MKVFRSFMTTSTGSLLLVFLLALSFRLAYFAIVKAGPLGNGDSPAYEDLALHIVHHQSYASAQSGGPGGFPTDLQRPPGYPLFLSLKDSILGNSRTATALAQCLINALFAAILCLFAGCLFTSRIALFAGIFYALDWATIVHTPLAISESLFVFLLGIAICLASVALVRSRLDAALAAGVLLGLSALVKPVAQVVLVAFLAAWLASKPRKPSLLLFVVAYAACVMPWMARNYLRHGVFTLSEISTVDLYFYSAVSTLHPQPTSDLANSGLNNEITALTDFWSRQQLTPRERARKMQRETWWILRHHWPTAAKQSTIGFARTCLGTSFITVSGSLGRSPGHLTIRALATVPELQVLGLWLLAMVGVWNGLHSRTDHAPRVLLIASLFLLLLPAASALGQSRFRLPVVPILCLLAAAGGDRILQRLRKSKTGYEAQGASTTNVRSLTPRSL